MTSDNVNYLRTLPAVRERCQKVYSLAKQDRLDHFELHPDHMHRVIEHIVDLVRSDYASPQDIPPHSRLRSFEAGGVDRIAALLDRWSGVDRFEKTRRLLDLCIVSVLVDAGAGDRWQFTEKQTGQRFGRTEGLGLAALAMFEAGLFSSVPDQPYQADAVGLQQLTVAQLEQGFQVTSDNPLVGVAGRHQLLQRLGQVLAHQAHYYPSSGVSSRPGNVLDYLLAPADGSGAASAHQLIVPVSRLWEAVLVGLQDVWPATRTILDGQSMGDVWSCPALKAQSPESPVDQLVPFHKLSQWLTYSIIDTIQQMDVVQFTEVELLTGLPEYRNGGLLVDHGVLALRPATLQRGLEYARSKQYNLDSEQQPTVPYFTAGDPAIVEWRALTVAILDQVAEQVRDALSMTPKNLPLAKVLECGTWKAGRRIAAEKRPSTSGPPIAIESDGTVF